FARRWRVRTPRHRFRKRICRGSSLDASLRLEQLHDLRRLFFGTPLDHGGPRAGGGDEIVDAPDSSARPARAVRGYAERGRIEQRDLHRGHLANTADADVARFVDPGLDRQHAGHFDVADLLASALDLAADAER